MKSFSKDTVFVAIVCCYLVCVFVTKFWQTELFFNGGDESRHAMNGVLFLDFIKDGCPGSPIDYARQYYQRYPNLSIHLLQPLFYPFEMIFFALFGVSALTARLSIFVLSLTTIFGFYYLIAQHLGRLTAMVAVSLLVLHPYFLLHANHVMLEIPGLCFLVLNAFLLLSNSKRKRKVGFVLMVIMPLLLSHKIAFTFLVAISLGFFAHSLRRMITGTIALTGICYIVVFFINEFLFSPILKQFFHLHLFRQPCLGCWVLNGANLTFALGTMLKIMAPAGVVLFIASLVIQLSQRQLFRNVFLLYCFLIVLWNFLFYSLFFLIDIKRVFIYTIPFMLVFISHTICQAFTSKKPFTKIIGLCCTICLIISFMQVPVIFSSLSGYQQAATYAITNNHSKQPILFDGIQSGNFVFCIRNIDSEKKQKVVRIDKSLFISEVYWKDACIKPVAKNTKEILRILTQEKIRFIVSEEIDYGLKWRKQFRQLLQQNPRFKKRKEFSIITSVPNYHGKKLVVYEYK